MCSSSSTMVERPPRRREVDWGRLHRHDSLDSGALLASTGGSAECMHHGHRLHHHLLGASIVAPHIVVGREQCRSIFLLLPGLIRHLRGPHTRLARARGRGSSDIYVGGCRDSGNRGPMSQLSATPAASHPCKDPARASRGTPRPRGIKT